MPNDFLVFLGRAWRNVNRRVSRVYLDMRRKRTSHEMDRLGSEGNGWYAPVDMPKGARCYCVGVGLDATFDFALAERGAEVFSFDPTPPAMEYIERENNGRVQFHPWGLLDTDSSMKLYYPMSEEHGSYFIHDLHSTGKYYEVPCYRLSTIMDKLNHEADSIYLMKIDIEGSWYEALGDVMASGIMAQFLEIEFDSPAPVWRVARITRLLEQNGYKLVLREADNAIFKHMPA